MVEKGVTKKITGRAERRATKQVIKKAVKLPSTKTPKNVIPPLSELKPRTSCKLCRGRGTLSITPPHLLGSKFRLVVPCSCVHKAIEWIEK